MEEEGENEATSEKAWHQSIAHQKRRKNRSEEDDEKMKERSKYVNWTVFSLFVERFLMLSCFFESEMMQHPNS